MIDERIRFWQKVVVKGPDDCWEWIGAIVSAVRGKGYGALKVLRNRSWKQEQAHRLSWEFANGAIPEGMHVLHKCDNSLCENPNHLFLGTNLDNIVDKVKKGRAKGNTNPDRSYVPKGSSCSWSVLTEAKIRSIKVDLDTGELSQAAIARKHGTDPSRITLIKQGKIWKSVQ